jgi:hypothetical protein
MKREQHLFFSLFSITRPFVAGLLGFLVLLALIDQRCPLLFGSSQIYGDCIILQNKPVAPDSMVVATAAHEFVHERIRLELPRIISWRPLPVTAPELHRRAHPRAAPRPNPRSG